MRIGFQDRQVIDACDAPLHEAAFVKRPVLIPVAALTSALAELLCRSDFRGCAFINNVGELAQTLPEVVAIARRHKDEMVAMLAALAPMRNPKARLQFAEDLALAIDGAIVRARFAATPTAMLKSLERTVRIMQRSAAARSPQ